MQAFKERFLLWSYYNLLPAKAQLHISHSQSKCSSGLQIIMILQSITLQDAWTTRHRSNKSISVFLQSQQKTESLFRDSVFNICWYIFLLPMMLCFFNLLNKHNQKADKKQNTGYPDSFFTVCHRESSSDSCSYSKQKDNGIIAQCLVKQARLSFAYVGWKSCCTASEIPDAHGTGIRGSFYLSEGLYLQGTGEGYHGGSQYIHISRYKAYQEQQDNFYQKDSLAPVKASGIAEFFLN